LGPGNLFDFDAAGPAIDPAHGVGEVDQNAPDRDELEEPRRGGPVVSRSGFGATRAPGLAIGPGADPGNDDPLVALPVEFDVLINESLERVNGVE